jgi:hypothetical protein
LCAFLGVDGGDSEVSALAFKVDFRPFRGRGGTKQYKRCEPVASAARGAGAERGPGYQVRPTFVCGPAKRTQSCCSASPTPSGGEVLRLRVFGVFFYRIKEHDRELESPPPEVWRTLRLSAKGSSKA